MGESFEGLAFRHTLLERGASSAELTGRLRRGELASVGRAAFVDAAHYRDLHADQQHLLRVEAAVGNQSTPVVISHTSAVLWHGLATWNVPLSRVHLTKDANARRRNDAHLKVHTHRLDPIEVVVVNGMAVTSPARTVLDVAAASPFEQAVVIADSALHQRLTTVADLQAGLDAFVGRHGRRRAAAVVAFADGRSESVGESRSRVLFSAAGLPMPTLQHEFRLRNGALVARVDFWWEQFQLVGEFDGLKKYRGDFAGADASDIVIGEKLREDKLRRIVAGVERWGWADLQPPASALVARLRSRLR